MELQVLAFAQKEVLTSRYSTGVKSGEKQIEVGASVIPIVTADLPTVPVSPVTKWKHPSDLDFGDSDYGTPAQVDILLEGGVFSKAVLHGWQFGSAGTPSGFKIHFGWVLNQWRGERQQ